MNFDTAAPFVKEDTAEELQNHAGKTQDTWVGAVENAEVAEIECAETMMPAELTEKSELLNLRHRLHSCRSILNTSTSANHIPSRD